MKQPKHRKPGRDSASHLWEHFGGKLNFAIVGILVAETALLLTVVSFWQQAEKRSRTADREIIKLEREVSELQRTNKGLQAVLDDYNIREADVVGDAGVQPIQFYVTDHWGRVVAGATVLAPRTNEQVTTKDTGLTDKLNLRLGDKVLLKKEGYEPIHVTIDQERFKSRLVAIMLRRKDHGD